MLVVGLLLGVLAPSASAAACPPVRVVAARGGVWVHRDGRTFRRVRTVRPGYRVELGRRAHLVLGRGRGRLGLRRGASVLGCRGRRPLLRLGSGRARAVRVVIDVVTREALARGAGATWTALRVPRRRRTFAHVERGLV